MCAGQNAVPCLMLVRVRSEICRSADVLFDADEMVCFR